MEGDNQNSRNYITDDGVSVQLWHGQAVESLKKLPDNSVDSIVTDPPYALSDDSRIDYDKVLRAWLDGKEPEMQVNGGFAGLTWDSFVPSPAVWKECYRVLKPGGHLLSFAGARTQDLMGMSIRLAGFRIKSQIAWVRTNTISYYTSLHNHTGDERHKNMFTGLRNILEPITVAQKPLGSTAIEAAEMFGTGGFYLDEAFIPFTDEEGVRVGKIQQRAAKKGFGRERKFYSQTLNSLVNKKDIHILGRYAGRMTQNLIFSHDADCVLPDESNGRVLLKDRTSDCVETCPVGKMTHREKESSAITTISDADVSMAEQYNSFFFNGVTPPHERPSSINHETGETVIHNTVKPLALMRWLVRLVTAEGGVVLDQFVGSGTTLEAAILEGRHSIGVEMTADYIELIDQRMKRQGAVIDTDGIQLSERVPLRNKRQSDKKQGGSLSALDLLAADDDDRALAV